MFIQFIGGAQFRNYLVEIFQETWWRSSGRLNEDLFVVLYFSQKHFFDSRVTHKQRYVKDSFLQRTSRYVSVGGGNVTNLCSACQSCWTKSLLMLSMSELSNKKLAYAQPVRVVEQKACLCSSCQSCRTKSLIQTWRYYISNRPGAWFSDYKSQKDDFLQNIHQGYLPLNRLGIEGSFSSDVPQGFLSQWAV